MGGCCGDATRVTVEIEYLVVGGKTCDRCGDSLEAVRAAVADARSLLPPSAATIELVERELGPDSLPDSNRVLVNGLPVERWLGGTAPMSDCPSCSELVGASVCCRGIEVGDVRSEAMSRDFVFDAIMAAAGGAAAEASGGACCPPARPGSPAR